MLTRLEIVNAMLASTGVAPVTTNDTAHPFYIKANNKLETVSREVQAPGWWFNKAVRTLKPNTAGEIPLPGNTLHADPVDTADGLTTRGGKMYDLANGSYVIGREVQVNYIDQVDIQDLPPTAATYVKALAVYEYYVDKAGEPMKVAEYSKAVQAAWLAMKAEHLKNADVNWFNGASAASMARGNRGRRLPT